MYVRRNIKWNLILRFAWFNVIIFTVWNLIVVNLYHYFDHMGVDIAIPFQPISLIGIAVAFYIGFKNNASYDRFWEAHKIWGGIVTYSRTWTNQVLCLIEGDEKTKQILIYRHIAWINALRIQLRQPNSFSIKENSAVESLFKKHGEQKPACEATQRFISKNEYDDLLQRKNPSTHLIKNQGLHLKQLLDENKITEFDKQLFHKTLEEFYNLQGKCERIKNTPFPRQYAYFSTLFTWIFILLLPFGMVGLFAQLDHNLTWLTIPFCVLISWVFVTMEIVGDNSEDPFENFINDVPMTALCRTIEIDLREMLGETDLPPKIKPENDILF